MKSLSLEIIKKVNNFIFSGLRQILKCLKRNYSSQTWENFIKVITQFFKKIKFEDLV